MEQSQTSPTEAEAFAALKSALEGSRWDGWSEGIEEACRSRRYKELLGMNSHPLWNTRNTFHFILQESNHEADGDFEYIEEKFKVPILQAMLAAAPDNESKGWFVNQPDSLGLTPLHMAALKGHKDIVGFLIDERAQLNSRDRDNKKPLHCAVGNLHPDVVKLLLKHLGPEDRIPYDNEFCTPADTLARNVEELEKTSTVNRKALNRAEEVETLLGGRQQENPIDSATCRILALGEGGRYDCYAFNRTVSELLNGSPPLIQAMRDHLLFANGNFRPRWQSYGVSLPQNKLEWVLRAATIIFHEEVGGGGQALTDRIKHMAESEKLRSPGYYQATPLSEHEKSKLDYDRIKQVNAILKNVSCIVLPILEVDSRERLKEGTYPQVHVQQQSLSTPTSPQADHSQESDGNRKFNEAGSTTEQSLDEYCHDFLKDEALDERNEDQVVGRYAKHRKLESDEIVIVSQLRIWKLGSFFISSYENDRDSSSSDQQCERLSHKIFKGDCSLPSVAAGDETPGALHAIIEACVRYEPRFPRSEPRLPRSEPRLPRSESRELLDGGGAFAVEIARESLLVAKYFQNYKGKLGRVDRHYKGSVTEETDTLLRLDDALGELAMIRRVHEDLRLICLERLNNQLELDGWAERSEIKLRRLEDDATRVRESLVTLLSLKQREVNTENLINSKLQSQILFVFTAATVLFAPLSWISSLMALNIKSFSPEDTIWSLSAAATASIVTLFGFAGLMLVTLIIWWWADERKDRTPKRKEQQEPVAGSEFSAQGGQIAPKGTQQRERTLRGVLFRRRRDGQLPNPLAEEV